MDKKVSGILAGSVTPPPSKSQAHRLLICAALGTTRSKVACDSLNDDLRATMDSLNALGASIVYADGGFDVIPVVCRKGGELPCGESGSTLRFLLPIAAALGADSTFTGKGKLPQRPMQPLCEALTAHGVEIIEHTVDAHIPLTCKGQLTGGEYSLAGDISSQYFTGLLFALPLLSSPSNLNIIGELTSASYVGMTLDALRLSGVTVEQRQGGFYIPAPQRYKVPAHMRVEGDWSAAAFWLVAGVIGRNPVTVCGMNINSLQGDRRIVDHLRCMGGDIRFVGDKITAYPSQLHAAELDCVDTPDLVPILSVAAAVAHGTTLFTHVGRLRYKESDRLAAMQTLLHSFGISSEIGEDTYAVTGGDAVVTAAVDSFGDHRIAMSAAILSTVACGETFIKGAECVAKSYPFFFEDFTALGGNVDNIIL
ncbi:MAG: 3-phosphoshikimate 1-carboxyvinyltransferase [Bacteroidaceae bacterium]|nr:3-phosphoshikimate 1-carboxyvinyltransferase [Bacteroidaceae bacterium]